MASVFDNAKSVIERMVRAELRCGREQGTVKLVAASKMNSAERVREAYGAGIRAFGENRAQEMGEKLRLNAYEGAELHFIGHLQRNKVKNVVGAAELIQSVDSEELIRLIGLRALSLGITQNILIEVNIGGETAKSGIPPEELDKLIEIAAGTDGICVQGLMTIPPVSEDISSTRRYFERMYNLFVDMGAKKYDNISMKFLSMGMSADFEEAIMAGANIVRVGTAVFGQRYYA
ncbi:MAG: YggS family pyridoxal phosphate-dependent enzyme [Oscillospiraceae bacterium]